MIFLEDCGISSGICLDEFTIRLKQLGVFSRCLITLLPRRSLPLKKVEHLQAKMFSLSKMGLDINLVSKNSGTPKSSILIGFSIINRPFWGTPIFGNTHISTTCCQILFFQRQVLLEGNWWFVEISPMISFF